MKKKFKLIGKQQLEIDRYQQSHERDKKTLKLLRLKFYAIGQPLNDNNLKFNKEQLKWCFSVLGLIETLGAKGIE